MTIFATIEPKFKRLIMLEAMDVRDAAGTIGLDPTQWDHGIVMVYSDWYSVNCFVYEFGLYMDPVKQYYFSMNGQLYAGNAVLYAAHGVDGGTVDLIEERIPPIIWFDSAADVEAAIIAKQVDRPIFAVNEVTQWKWPDPTPPFPLPERFKR